jgi:hypothetical protein
MIRLGIQVNIIIHRLERHETYRRLDNTDICAREQVQSSVLSNQPSVGSIVD